MTSKSGFDLIPSGAKVVAAIAFVAITFLFLACFGFFWNGFRGAGLGTFISVPIAVFVGALMAGYVLLAGYVYGDAARRGMPPIPWTLLAVLVPNCLGFVLYFLLRKPLVGFCPDCGCGNTLDAAFCSRCGHSQIRAAS